MELDAEHDAEGDVRRQGAGLLPQADELPDAQPDLRGARPLLPRAAAAAVRVRHGLPVREVRRRARPDPGARASPRTTRTSSAPGSRCATSSTPADVRARPAARLRARRLLPRAVHPQDPEKFVGTDEDWERGHRDAARGGRGVRASSWSSIPGGAAFYGPKISVQAKDAIGRTWQMSTIQVDFNLPRAVRAWSTRPPTAPGSGRS